MANKSVTQSIRLSEEERSKLRELKEKNRISWAELIECAKKLLSEEINKQ